MPSDWRECTLGDAITLKRGYDLPAKERRPGHVPIVSSSGFTDLHAEAMAKAPGVVTGRYGTIGSVFYVDRDFWPLNTTLYVQDFKGNYPRFVAYLLRTVDFFQFSDKAAVPGVNRNHLHTTRIVLPPLAEQVSIASHLQSLDDRIDVLRQTNATLEAIAQALFKSWFIDFDPVRAKAEGREPEGMDAETAALFPSEFEESELGAIPKGWATQRLGSFIELAYGKALKASERRAGNVPVYGSGGITGFHDEALVRHPSIIVGRKGTVGALYWEDRPFFAIDTTFYVRPIRAPLTFCYYVMQRLGLETMNTDAAVPGLNRENAYRLEVVLPSERVLQVFDQITSCIRDSIQANARRVELLSSLRDALLPRLISGRLTLSERQEHLEGVAS